MEKTYAAMRATVAMLKVNGYANDDVGQMPLGRMYNEAQIVKDIVNARIQTEAVLLQAAASSIMSAEAGKHFMKLIQDLSNGR